MRALLATVLLLAAGCGGDDDGGDCGPGEAGADLEVGDVTFSDFTASPNNDCTPVQGQEPTSITIQGEQSDPDGTGFLVLCLPRPDEIESETAISLADDELIVVIDLFGQDQAGCSVRVDDPATGTATFSGYCDDGADDDGFALALTGTVTVTRTCGDADPTTEALDLDGDAAVAAAQL
ncbi:MAG TPA: hypothetical protein VMZ28_14360 [Kofleriaceae bacterium]|nr:hypothetical protein [Kofleriaceae bacterium]